MTELMRYAVFALMDDQTTSFVRMLQRSLSDRTGDCTVSFFPVHVTVRGRFLTNSSSALSAFKDIAHSKPFEPYRVELVGPVFRSPDLVWLQVRGGTAGSQQLGSLHEAVDAMTLPLIVEDEVSPLHRGKDYCPHVTLGWGCSEAGFLEYAATQPPLRFQARLKSLALVKYPQWPLREDVQIVAEADFS